MKTQITQIPQLANGADMLSGLLDSVNAFINDIKVMEIRLNLIADGILLETVSTPKPKTELAKSWSQLKNLPHSFLDRTPAQASGVVSLGWTGPTYEKIMGSAMALANSLIAPSNKDLDKEQTGYLK